MIDSEIYKEMQKNQKKQNDQKLGKIREEKLLNYTSSKLHISAH